MSWLKRFADAVSGGSETDYGTEITATVDSVDDDGKVYVCMAGDPRPVPASSSSVMVSPGDTVKGKLLKGRFMVEGNITDKAVGPSHVEAAKKNVMESANAKLEVLDNEIRSTVEDEANGLRSLVSQTAGEIRSEVEYTYLSKDDAEDTYLSQDDAVEVYASKSLVSQTATDITSTVSTTYVSKNDAEQTYATKSSLQQTSTALTAIIDDAVVSTTQLWYAKAANSKPSKPTSEVTNETDEYDKWTTVVPTYSSSKKYYFYCYQQELVSGSFIWSDVVREKSITDAQSAAEAAQTTASAANTTANSANALATTLSTYVRMVSGYGLLVTYTGYAVGALVRSGGSFDIVKLTWSNGTPTIGNTLAAFDSTSIKFNNGESNPIASLEKYSGSGLEGYTLTTTPNKSARSIIRGRSTGSYSDIALIADYGGKSSSLSLSNGYNGDYISMSAAGPSTGSYTETSTTMDVLQYGAKISTRLFLGGHSSPIGTRKTVSKTEKTVGDSTGVNMCSVSLEAGTWVVTGTIGFPSNAAGVRRAVLSNTSASTSNDEDVAVVAPGSSNGRTTIQKTRIVSPSSTTTFYLSAYQNSGGSLSCVGYIEAVRIA